MPGQQAICTPHFFTPILGPLHSVLPLYTPVQRLLHKERHVSRLDVLDGVDVVLHSPALHAQKQLCKCTKGGGCRRKGDGRLYATKEETAYRAVDVIPHGQRISNRQMTRDLVQMTLTWSARHWAGGSRAAGVLRTLLTPAVHRPLVGLLVAHVGVLLGHVFTHDSKAVALDLYIVRSTQGVQTGERLGRWMRTQRIQ